MGSASHVHKPVMRLYIKKLQKKKNVSGSNTFREFFMKMMSGRSTYRRNWYCLQAAREHSQSHAAPSRIYFIGKLTSHVRLPTRVHH
jgi:hypothetical protein